MPDYHRFASAHGRFQPVHNGHVEYLLEAKNRCEVLYVGLTQLTQYRLKDVSLAARHRAELKSNPLTFFERHELVTGVLLDLGISHHEFHVLPFPIEEEAVLHEFLPNRIPVLTTVYDDWNREKIRLLEQKGYPVEVLWERREKKFSGSRVRELIAAGDDSYVSMVPEATVRAVRQLGIRERLVSSGQVEE